MPRGGKRRGAGRRSTWVSGCTREDTKPIRVPKTIADRVMDIAHRLDAGEQIDLDTQSIIQENQALRDEVELLKTRMEELKQDNVTHSKIGDRDIEKYKTQALSILNMGGQAATYKKAKKVLNEFVKLLEL